MVAEIKLKEAVERMTGLILTLSRDNLGDRLPNGSEGRDKLDYMKDFVVEVCDAEPDYRPSGYYDLRRL